MAGYNLTRTVDEVLQHFEKDEKNLPSFTVHLHLEYWTLNNGSKFLYNNPVASLLDDIQAHRIPVDFLELFDSAKVPFYDGCMIVELLDYRPQKSKDPPPEKPERTRVVLHPNSETLWADICLLNQKTGNQWTDQDALEIEARLLLAIAPPLCLDPDPHLSRIANNILRVSTPTVPVSLKRKASVLDPEEDETDKARRAKLMQFMDPRQHRSHAPSYRILEHIQSQKMTKSGQPQSADPQPPLQTASTPTPAVLQPASPIVVAIPSAHVAEPAQNIKKAEPAHAPPLYRNDNRSNTSGSSTPVNGQPVNHYMRLKPNGQQSPSPVAQSPMQPSRASVPTQQQYQQSTQIPSQPTQPLRPSPPQHIQSASPNFQGAVPQGTFFTQVPPQRNVQPKPGSGNVPLTQGTPQQTNAQKVPTQNPQHPQIHPTYMQMQAAAQRQATVQNQNGRATPQTQPSRNSINPTTAAAQRGSPLAANPRSPMPNAAAAQMTHSSQHYPGVAQYNAHIRAIQHHPPHLVNGGSQTGGPSPTPQGQQQMQPSQDPQMMSQYQMYGYAQMSLPNYGMVPGRPYVWPAGRGMSVNGQHQIPGVPPNGGHPQHMLNVGKAVPGGMQGR